MNIFLCCLQSSRNYPIARYRHWRENFKPALEAMGHRVFEPVGLDLALPLLYADDLQWLKNYREHTSEQLIQQVRQIHKRQGIDLFFSYFYALHVFPNAIRAIGRLGIPTVNFFCDNLRQFHSVAELINSYTLNWVPEKEACEIYRRRGAAYIHLPMAGNPCFYNARLGTEIPQVTFIGSPDRLRMELLASTLGSRLPLKVYGRGWIKEKRALSLESGQRLSFQRIAKQLRISLRQHSQRLAFYGPVAEWRHFVYRKRSAGLLPDFKDIAQDSLSHVQMLEIAVNSTVLLGINRCPHPGYPWNKPLVYSRLRDIEGPMMGACYLTEYCPDLGELYELGKEIAVYRNREELISEAERLLKDEGARRMLRKLGQKAAISRHTWQHRFQALFQALRLNDNAF